MPAGEHRDHGVSLIERIGCREMVLAAALALGCGDPVAPPPPPEPVDVRVHAIDPAAPTLVLGCKVVVDRLDGPDPTWGVMTGFPEHIGEWRGATLLEGSTALASTCDLVVPLVPGRYALTVANGPERESARTEIDVLPDGVPVVEVELPRAVDSSGWACGDLHVHSAPSVDSDVPLDQRLVSAVAEGLDLMAPTDHDALVDWRPALAATELEGRIAILPGNEISPGVGDAEWKGHFGVVGVPEDIVLPEDMPHLGMTVDAILHAARMRAPDALISINHPRSSPWVGYFTIIDFDPAAGTGRAGMLAADFDLFEVWNGHVLDNGADAVEVETLLDDWYALLRGGRHVVATGASDTHRLARTPVGSPRTCVRVAVDEPGRLTPEAYLEGLRAGDAFATSGPFVDLTVQGQGLGAVVTPDASGEVDVVAHVQAPAWVSVDRVTVVVNGDDERVLTVSELPGNAMTRLAIAEDAFVLVRVEGDTPLGVPAGAPLLPMRSLAFTNPVWVDADGDGLIRIPERPSP